MVSTRSSCSFTFGMRCFRRGTCVSGKCRKSGSLGETEKHPFCPQGIRRDRLQRFDSYASFLNMSDHALCSSIDRWQHYGVICKLAARREKRYDECQQIGQSGRRIYSYSREMTQPRERGRRELESHSLFLSRAVYILWWKGSIRRVSCESFSGYQFDLHLHPPRPFRYPISTTEQYSP